MKSFERYFFHLGLHKTGTTYLQQNIFPFWSEINYITWRNLEYFLRLKKEEKYLISCEGFSGTTFSNIENRCLGIQRLGSMFPGANTIIAFRPHGDFVASLYSQYIRYGGHLPFNKFYSLSDDANNGIIAPSDLSYEKIIKTIEDSFGTKPFVFQLNELKKSEQFLLKQMARFMSCQQNSNSQSLNSPSAKNPSLGAWQGELLRKINARAGTKHSPDGRNRPFSKLRQWKLDPTFICHKLLSRLPGKKLVAKNLTEEINQAYQQDWNFVLDYINASEHRKE